VTRVRAGITSTWTQPSVRLAPESSLDVLLLALIEGCPIGTLQCSKNPAFEIPALVSVSGGSSAECSRGIQWQWALYLLGALLTSAEGIVPFCRWNQLYGELHNRKPNTTSGESCNSPLVLSSLPLRMRAFLPGLLFAIPRSVQGYALPGACSGICTNTHDPSIITRNGVYYRFSTGGRIAIHTAPSIAGPWSYKGPLLPKGSMVNLRGNQDLWVCPGTESRQESTEF
jgi:hypothetical protein